MLYDAFITHAVEDKKAIADALADGLKAKGLSIWYSGHDLKPGENITTAINRAILNSRSGIIVVSPNYVDALWARAELNVLYSRHLEGMPLIPIFHQITAKEVAQFHPLLAQLYSLSSAIGVDALVEEVCNKLVTEEYPEATKVKETAVGLTEPITTPSSKKKKEGDWSWILYALLAALLLVASPAIYGWWSGNDRSEPISHGEVEVLDTVGKKAEEKPPIPLTNEFELPKGSEHKNTFDLPSEELGKQFDALIRQRMAAIQQTVSESHQEAMIEGGTPTSINELAQQYEAFREEYGDGTNEYRFSNDYSTEQFRVNMPALNVDVATQSPINAYGFTNYYALLRLSTTYDKECELEFSVINTAPCEYAIETIEMVDETTYYATVAYTNNVRHVLLSCIKMPGSSPEVIMYSYGLRPVEEYVFQQEGGHWLLAITE